MLKPINREINASHVKLVQDGQAPVLMTIHDALAIANEQGIDLVQMNNDRTPIVKIMDYGKIKYEHQKRLKNQTKANKENNKDVKEIHLRPNISIGDLKTKAKRANQFIEKGNKVKVVIKFRGREVTHKQVGFQLVDSLKGLLENYKFDVPPTETPREIVMIIMQS